MSEANWPIRVGGVYDEQNGFSGLRQRVTAIEGDTIYREWADGTFPAPRPIPAAVFRMCRLPEDQSPIPALVAALERFVDFFDKSLVSEYAEMAEQGSAALAAAKEGVTA